MARKKDPTQADMLNDIIGHLKRQASEPNLYGYKPHEKQLAFHNSTKRARLYIGGNRSGKSVGGVVEDLWWVTGRHPYRKIPDKTIRGRVIGVDFNNGVKGILLPIFKRWIIPSDLQHGSWERSWSESDRTLTLANGNFIEFKSNDQDLDKHAGTSRDFIHFDEEPPRSIFEENLVRLIDVGGSWWITMTPVQGLTWTYNDLYEPWDKGKRTDIDVIKVSMKDNPHVSAEERLLMLAFLSEDKRAIREEGNYVPKGGLVYPDFMETVHSTLHGWVPPRDWLIYHSLDHGFNNPTASLHHAVSPTGDQVITYHEHYKNEMTVKEHAKAILTWEQDTGTRVFLRTGDPAMKQRQAASGTSIQALYSDEGIYFSLDSVPRDVAPGVDKISSYLKVNPNSGRPFWQISDCPNLTRELTQLHWAYYASGKLEDTNNPKETIQKKNDHACDAARYFFTFLPELSALGLDMWNPNEALENTGSVGTIWDLLTHDDKMFNPDVKWDIQTGFDLSGVAYE